MRLEPSSWLASWNKSGEVSRNRRRAVSIRT
jgi:hypothetical protein